MFGLKLLLFFLVVTGVNGWWWGGRGNRPNRYTRYTRNIRNTRNIINCHCNRVMKAMLVHLDKLEKKIETRDVAEILDVDEDYPGLKDFAVHLDTKRDGTIDKQKLASVIKQTPSLRSINCNCGQALLTKFKKGLL